MIFIPFLPPPDLAVNNPDEEHVAFVVLIDIMQNQSEDSGLPSQPAAPRESWKTPFRRTLDCFTKCFGSIHVEANGGYLSFLMAE
ncbi:unnamed protein product [Nyctereutes procyonoides]|uniref:(raccoon dog) hypothetical protein n=1 Tax=Nyctereutes procyonoides TaxID=34880 RepID=A0A811Z1V4_NYCPR|nr:unnamed protein product [Nyctereutes procyonoides]